MRGHYHSGRVSTRLALGKYAEHLKLNEHENFYADTNRETETRTHAHKNAHARAKITNDIALHRAFVLLNNLIKTISLTLKIKNNSGMIRSTMRHTQPICVYIQNFLKIKNTYRIKKTTV